MCVYTRMKGIILSLGGREGEGGDAGESLRRKERVVDGRHDIAASWSSTRQRDTKEEDEEKGGTPNNNEHFSNERPL